MKLDQDRPRSAPDLFLQRRQLYSSTAEFRSP